MIATLPLTDLIQTFFRRHLIFTRGVSPHTLHAYRDAIRGLLAFAVASQGGSVVDLTLDDLGRDRILAFLEDLETRRGNTAATRNARLAAIHSLFRFIAAEDPAAVALCARVLAIPYKRTPARAVTCLSREDVEHLFNSIDRSTALGRRDLALLHFLYNTGARAQEVVDLRLPAVRFDAPAQVRLLGKGRKERLCPLWSETTDLLRAMLKDRTVSTTENAPLFVNATGHPLTRFGLGHIVRMRVTAAAPSRPALSKTAITPHTFRHTTALHLLQAGVELNVVRSWLGHASIETTHAYIEIDMQMKRAAIQACESPSLETSRPLWVKPDLLTWLEAL
jgi:site-specific recombinase XerD